MSTASSASVVELDVVADDPEGTASSPYFSDDGAAAAFSWPAAERTRSTLAGTHTLRNLCDNHGVSRDYRPYFAHDRAACAGDLPADTAAVYADALDAGLRLPLHDFHAALLRHYGLAPGQLAPNAWRYVAAFVLLCKDAAVEPMLSVFQHFFSICTHKGDASGWHHFMPSNSGGPNSGRRLFTGKVSRTYAGWKTRFFFLQAPPNAPWPCPVRWGKPTRTAVRRPAVTSATKAAIDRLLDRVGQSGADVGKFLSRRLPVGRVVSLSPELAAVKREPGMVSDQQQHTRKRKSPEHHVPAATTPRSATPPLARSSSGRSGSGGERSATRALAELAQQAEAELHGKERELQARAGEVAQVRKELRAARELHAADVARLGDELRAARDARAAEVGRLEEELRNIGAVHAAEVSRLREELQVTNAEASRLAEELQRLGAEHAAEVQAVRVQQQWELMNLEHQSVVAMNERYAMGLRRMRSLAQARYPDVVDPAELKHELLPDEDDKYVLGLGLPTQPPAVDQ